MYVCMYIYDIYIHTHIYIKCYLEQILLLEKILKLHNEPVQYFKTLQIIYLLTSIYNYVKTLTKYWLQYLGCKHKKYKKYKKTILVLNLSIAN